MGKLLKVSLLTSQNLLENNGQFPSYRNGQQTPDEQFKIKIENRGKPMLVKMEKLENSPVL